MLRWTLIAIVFSLCLITLRGIPDEDGRREAQQNIISRPPPEPITTIEEIGLPPLSSEETDPVFRHYNSLREKGIKQWTKLLTTDHLAGYDKAHIVNSFCDKLQSHEQRQMCRKRGRRIGERLIKHFRIPLTTARAIRAQRASRQKSWFTARITISHGIIKGWSRGIGAAHTIEILKLAYLIARVRSLVRQGLLSYNTTADIVASVADSCDRWQYRYPISFVTSSPKCNHVVPLSGIHLQQRSGFTPKRPLKRYEELKKVMYFRASPYNVHRWETFLASGAGLYPWLDAAAFMRDGIDINACTSVIKELQEMNHSLIRAPLKIPLLNASNQPNIELCHSIEGRERISFDDMLEQKYQLIVDGYAGCFRLAGTMKGPGVPVLVRQTQTDMSYTFDMIPYVHYLPVDNELEKMLPSMNSTYHWAEKYDAVTRNIAKESARYAEVHAGNLAHSIDWALYYAFLVQLHVPESKDPSKGKRLETAPKPCRGIDDFFSADHFPFIPELKPYHKAEIYRIACEEDLGLTSNNPKAPSHTLPQIQTPHQVSKPEHQVSKPEHQVSKPEQLPVDDFDARRAKGLEAWKGFLSADHLSGYDKAHVVNSVCNRIKSHEEGQMCRKRGRRIGERLSTSFKTPLTSSRAIRAQKAHSLKNRYVPRITISRGSVVGWSRGGSGAEEAPGDPLKMAFLLARVRGLARQGLLTHGGTVDIVAGITHHCDKVKSRFPVVFPTSSSQCKFVVPISGAHYPRRTRKPAKKLKELKDMMYFRAAPSLNYVWDLVLASKAGVYPWLNASSDQNHLGPCISAIWNSWTVNQQLLKEKSATMREQFFNTTGQPNTALCHQVLKQGPASLDTALEHKYQLVSIDAGAFELAEIMEGPGVPVLVESATAMSYTADMVPYVHYLPISDERTGLLRNLEATYHWAEKNDAVTKSIAEESTDYAKKHAGERAQSIDWALYYAFLVHLHVPEEKDPSKGQRLETGPKKCGDPEFFSPSHFPFLDTWTDQDKQELFFLACKQDLELGSSAS